MDSPITADQREGCIPELKWDNYRDARKLWHGAFFILLVSSAPALTWLGFINEPVTERNTVILYSITLPVACACFVALAWVLYCCIAGLMLRYAAPVFAQTGLVDYVLGLPSDVQAYRGRLRAVLVGEWLTFKPERFDARRRANAIIMRFGTWSRRFGGSPEPWSVRLAIYTAFCASAGYFYFMEWLATQPYFQQSAQQFKTFNPPFDYLLVGLLFLIGLWFSVLHGRTIGLRLALIDHFTAEAARGGVNVAGDGASDG